MKKILIILTGVLLVYSEPVLANNEITGIALSKKVTKVKVKKKKVSKKYKSVKKKTSKKKYVKVPKRIRYSIGEMQQYAHNMIFEYGWTEEDYQALVLIVYKESSWRPEAVNKKSKSCGLFQAFPCSKMAKYGKDYRTNYKTQMKFGFEYIKARYGNPQSAWAFWQKHHWY
jgi:hypothetical protein